MSAFFARLPRLGGGIVFGFVSVARLSRQCGGSCVGTDSAESGVPVIYFPRPPPLLLAVQQVVACLFPLPGDMFWASPLHRR